MARGEVAAGRRIAGAGGDRREHTEVVDGPRRASRSRRWTNRPRRIWAYTRPRAWPVQVAEVHAVAVAVAVAVAGRREISMSVPGDRDRRARIADRGTGVGHPVGSVPWVTAGHAATVRRRGVSSAAPGRRKGRFRVGTALQGDSIPGIARVWTRGGGPGVRGRSGWQARPRFHGGRGGGPAAGCAARSGPGPLACLECFRPRRLDLSAVRTDAAKPTEGRDPR